MANQLFQGYVYDDAGAAIVGATVNLYTRNTVTPVLATTTTDANGLWTISYATEGRFDVEIVSGSSKRRRKYDDQIQLDTIEVSSLRMRNPANTFDYQVAPAAIIADRQLNLPLLTATETLAVLGAGGLAQALSNIQSIGFPATQVPSADANTLDDYEEGTWTPGSAVGSATTVSGGYTKIGRVVFFTGSLTWPVQVDAGAASMTGLPFTSSAATANAAAAFIRYTTLGSYFTMYIDLGATTISHYNLSGASLTYTQMSGLRQDFAGFYPVA